MNSMKLLIITQKVDRNDPILGFFHRWIIEFAKHYDSILVICLEKGIYDLPENVRVLSLGKEQKVSRLQYILRFYSYIWKERKNYDSVFVHMNPIYIVLGGVIWKILHKKITLWYTHKSVDWKLFIAEKFVNKIFTASKESFRLKSGKVMIVGHGIDTELYSGIVRSDRNSEDVIRIIQVGRITKIKNCDTLIQAVCFLKKSWNRKFEVFFIGSPVTSIDYEYKKIIDDLVKKSDLSDTVTFLGSISNDDIGKQYAQADVSINLTQTGGIDKVILESLATGVPTFFSNEALIEVYKPYDKLFKINIRDSLELSEKIKLYFSRNDRVDIEFILRNRIIEQFNIVSLITRISSYL